MNLQEELELLLPTRGARWTAALTATLLPLVFSAPHFLQPLLMPKATEAEIVLLQILLSGVVAVFGTLLALLQILWYLRNEEKGRSDVLKELNKSYQEHAPRIRQQREEINSKP